MSERRHWFRTFAALLVWLPAARVVVAAEDLKPNEVRQNLFSTCFVSDQEFWIAGELGRIYHTTDAGKSFHQVDTGTKQAFLSVACLPGGGIVAVGQYGLALRSRDKGATWSAMTSGTKRNLLSVKFANDQVGVAVGDFGTIMRTADGGDTWSQVSIPDPLPLPEDIAEIINPGDILLYDIAFANPQRAWIVGEFGIVLTSADGGATWTAQQSGIETTLFGVTFTDEKNGWATGLEQTMLHTADGGATWEKQKVQGRSGFVLSLFDVVVSGQNGWAIGDSGFLLHSSNGGQSWDRVELPIQLAANWFRGVDLAASGGGFVVGSEGMMLLLQGDQYHELKRPQQL